MIIEELVTTLGLEIRDTGLPEFQNRIKDTIGKLGLLGAGVVGVAAAITGMAASVARDVNSTAKFSRAVGVGVDELQRLELAAKLVGSSGEEIRSFLQEVQNAIDTMGTGGADALFNALSLAGIEPLDENGNVKGGIQLIKELADAAFNAETRVEALNALTQLNASPQLRKAFQDLGSEGFLAKGAGALVPSPADIARSEAFVAAMEKLTARLDQLKLEIGGPLLGLTTEGVEAFLEYSRTEGFSNLKGDVQEIIGLLVEATKAAGGLYGELSKAMPEGSAGAQLLTASGFLLATGHPILASLALLGALDDSKEGGAYHNVITEEMLREKLQEFVMKGSGAADALSSFLDYLPGSGYQPPAADFLPRGGEPGDRAAQQMTARSIVIEKLTIEVPGLSDGKKLFDALDTDPTINRAAERGTGGAR